MRKNSNRDLNSDSIGDGNSESDFWEMVDFN